MESNTSSTTLAEPEVSRIGRTLGRGVVPIPYHTKAGGGGDISARTGTEQGQTRQLNAPYDPMAEAATQNWADDLRREQATCNRIMKRSHDAETTRSRTGSGFPESACMALAGHG